MLRSSACTFTSSFSKRFPRNAHHFQNISEDFAPGWRRRCTSNCKIIGHFSIQSHHFQGEFSIISAFPIQNFKESWHLDCNPQYFLILFVLTSHTYMSFVTSLTAELQRTTSDLSETTVLETLLSKGRLFSCAYKCAVLLGSTVIDCTTSHSPTGAVQEVSKERTSTLFTPLFPARPLPPPVTSTFPTPTSASFAPNLMNFALKLMNYALKLMHFALEMSPTGGLSETFPPPDNKLLWWRDWRSRLEIN